MNHDTYLEAKVLTAPSHRLHLMLIEGAIRVGQQAEQAIAHGDFAAASPYLLRMIDIVGEMLVGIRQSKSDLCREIAGLYWFMIRQITETITSSNAGPLRDAIKLLEFERGTWRQVCDKLGSAASTDMPLGAPIAAAKNQSLMPGTKSFSLEA